MVVSPSMLFDCVSVDSCSVHCLQDSNHAFGALQLIACEGPQLHAIIIAFLTRVLLSP